MKNLIITKCVRPICKNDFTIAEIHLHIMHGFYKKDSRTMSLRLYIPRIVSRVTYRNYTLKT